MAIFRDHIASEFPGNTPTWVPSMPVHQAGDILLAAIGKDGNTGFTADPSGWTPVFKQATAGAYGALYWKEAASDAEQFSITLSTTDTGVAWVGALIGVDKVAGVIHSSNVRTSDDATAPYSYTPNLVTNEDDLLVLHLCWSDTTVIATAYPPMTNLCAISTIGGLAVAYNYLKNSGSDIPNAWFYGITNDDTRQAIVTIRSTGEYTPAHLTEYQYGDVIRPLAGLSTTQGDTWPTSYSYAPRGKPPHKVLFWDTATWTDISANFGDVPVAVSVAMTAVDRALYFGSRAPIEALGVNITTISGGTGSAVFEYWDGTAWVSTGRTQNLALTGWGSMGGFIPSTATTLQCPTSIEGTTLYWMRVRVTSVSSATAVTLTGATCGPVGTYAAATALTYYGTNPYQTATAHAGLSTANLLTLRGFQVSLGDNVDATSGLLLYGAFRADKARDLAVDISNPYPLAAHGGVQVTFADASNYYQSYTIAAKGAKDIDYSGWNLWAINLDLPGFGASNTAPNRELLRRFYFESQGYYGAPALRRSMLAFIGYMEVAGGAADNPIGWSEVSYAVNQAYMLPLIKLDGTIATVSSKYIVGGGVEPVHLDISNSTVVVPPAYDGVDYFLQRTAPGDTGFLWWPGTAEDEIIARNCVFSGPPSSFDFSFPASQYLNASATVDFSGSTIINGDVYLDATYTFSEMTFVACLVMPFGAAMDKCIIDSSSFFAHDVQALASITNCTFIKSDEPDALNRAGIRAGYKDLCANGTFANDTGWVLGTGWAVAAGELVASTTTQQSATYAITGLVSGHFYTVGLIISSYVSGEVEVYINGTGRILAAAVDADGLYTFEYEALSDSDALVIRSAASGTTSLAIDAVTIFDTTPITLSGNEFQGYAAQWDGTGDPCWESVALLIKMNGADYSTTFVDERSHVVNNVLAAAEQRNLQSRPWYSTSGSFSAAAASKLQITWDEDLELGDPYRNEWTLDFWVYPTLAGTQCYLVGNIGTVWKRGTWGFFSQHPGATADKYSFWIANEKVHEPVLTSAASVVLNTWTHIAITLRQNDLALFINGILDTLVTVNATLTSAADKFDWFVGGGYTGYMADLRLTNGFARWRTGFAVPTAATPTAGGDVANAAILLDLDIGTYTFNIENSETSPSIAVLPGQEDLVDIIVVNTVSLTLSGLVSGSDVVILDAGATTHRVDIDQVVGSTAVYAYEYPGSVEYVDVCVYKAGYVPYVVRNYPLTANAATLPINQVLDRNYLDPT